MLEQLGVLCWLIASSLGHGDGGEDAFMGQRELLSPYFWSGAGGSMLSLPPRGGGDSFPRQRRPDGGNLADLCRSLDRRESPPSPGAGAGDGAPTRTQTRTRTDHSLRAVTATHAMEAALAGCCREPQEHARLTCSTEAWERSLRDFCEDELSVKHLPHRCCLQRGERRWECFTWAAARSQPHTSSTAEGVAAVDRTVAVDLPFPGPWTPDEISSLPPRAGDGGRVLTLPFPRQRPDADNVGDICRYLGQRDPHPPGTLPRAGFAHLRRLVAATLAMEAGFTACCSDSHARTRLQCSLDTWTRTLDDLCGTGLPDGAPPHLCCRMPGRKRHECFSWAAPAQSYHPPAHGRAEVLDFTHTDFPPGRPSEENIGNICRDRRKPLTLTPVSELVELTPRQLVAARLRTQLAGLYSSCCARENPLHCARAKWSELLTQWCVEPAEAASACCRTVGAERDSCFASSVLFPNYDREVLTLDLAAVSERELDILCRSSMEASDEGPQRLLVTTLQRCCQKQTGREKLACGVNKLAAFADRACNRDSSKWNDILSCCSQDTQNCFNTRYLAQVKVYLQVA